MGTWVVFFVAVALGVFMLYTPGYICLRLCGLSRFDALPAAPAVTCVFFSFLSALFEPLSVHADLCTLVLLPTMVLFALSVLKGRRANQKESTRSLDLNTIVLYCLMGILTGLYVLVKPLDGPGSFFLGWDAIRHINEVQAYAESGNMSFLSSGVYETASDVLYSPFFSEGGFYPSNWHIVAALMAQTLGTPSTVAVNACNYLFSAIVFPISMAQLVRRAFSSDELTVRAGAFVTPCFIAFPWMFFAFGPLYPNMAAMSMLPSTASLCMDAIGYEGDSHPSFFELVAAGLSVTGLTLTHSSTLFSLGVVGLVFIAWRLGTHEGYITIAGHRYTPTTCMLCFIAVFCFAWGIACRLPFMQGIVTYDWEAFSSKRRMLANIVTLSYSYGWVPSVVPQHMLALLLGVGLVDCSRRKESIWMPALYVLVCFALFVGATTNGSFKYFFTGFWYNDHNRIAAMCAMFGVPLAARGLSMLCGLALAFGKIGRVLNHKKTLFVDLFLTAVTLVILLPTVTIPLLGTVDTAFGAMTAQLRLNQEPNYGPLHWEERAFMDEVMKVVPHGAIVANRPYDGSMATYAAYDLHVLYRSMMGIPGGDNEKPESVLVRKRLNSIASDEDVQEAVEKLGIEYVLLLHLDDVNAMYPRSEEYAAEENWVGITSINQKTPGFELVLNQDDLELYRVVR